MVSLFAVSATILAVLCTGLVGLQGFKMGSEYMRFLHLERAEQFRQALVDVQCDKTAKTSPELWAENSTQTTCTKAKITVATWPFVRAGQKLADWLIETQYWFAQGLEARVTWTVLFMTLAFVVYMVVQSMCKCSKSQEERYLLKLLKAQVGGMDASKKNV